VLDDYRIVRANVFSGGHRSTMDRLMPASLFTDPELARVGLTEKEAKAAGRVVKVAVVPASIIPRARTSGHTLGVMKGVIDAATGEILGVTLLAANAGEMISTVEVAMIGKLPYTTLRDAVLTHPTMTEGLNYLFAGL
jgi:probable pyridine nucleotide-disulfide oxidoreductase